MGLIAKAVIYGVYGSALSLKILLISSFFLSPIAYACESPDLLAQIDISHEISSYPTIPKLVSFEVVAPVSYEGWQLRGASCHEGGNNIPLRQYIVKTAAGSEVATFTISLVPKSIKNSTLAVIYSPPEFSQSAENNCLWLQKIEYDI